MVRQLTRVSSPLFATGQNPTTSILRHGGSSPCSLYSDAGQTIGEGRIKVHVEGSNKGNG